MRKRILIINENVAEATNIKERLVSAYNDVECVTSISDAVNRFVSMDFTLVILDANMSMEDDHKLLKVMRQAKRTPILLLSSQADHSERLRALQAGAHAYMGHPYSLEECLAQAEALMQLYIEAHPGSNLCYTLVFGKDLVIDPSTRQVFLKGKELNFTRKEFDLLFCLASNAGRVISREQLYEQVWSEDAAYDVDGLVKTHIKTLRKKLSESGTEYIKNVWGVGYRFSKEHGVKAARRAPSSASVDFVISYPGKLRFSGVFLCKKLRYLNLRRQIPDAMFHNILCLTSFTTTPV